MSGDQTTTLKGLYHPETGELLNGLARSLLSNDGRLEYPDPVPMAPPIDLRAPPSGMRKLVQELIRQEISELATNMEMESFEESDDFEIEDDPLDPITPYEAVFDPRDDRNPERAGGGSAPTEGGAVIAVSAPPSLSPTNGSGSPQLEPNVKRSESNVPSTGERLIGSDTGPSASVPTTRRPA